MILFLLFILPLIASDEFDPNYLLTVYHDAESRYSYCREYDLTDEEFENYQGDDLASHCREKCNLEYLSFSKFFYGVVRNCWICNEQEEPAAAEIPPSLVNIVPFSQTTNGTLLFQLILPSNEVLATVELSVKYDPKFGKLPRISRLEELENFIYLITLNDGSKWLTEPKNEPWKEWDVGTRVVKFGTGKHPCLLNRDRERWGKSYFSTENCLINLTEVTDDL